MGVFDLGGQSGLLTSKIGPEMSRLPMEGARELRELRGLRDEREDGPLLPLSESVSFDHENERLHLLLERGVFFSGERGSVLSPIGMRWSPSLTERFSFIMASSPSIVAQTEGWTRCFATWWADANGKGTHEFAMLFYLCF